jgi:hypothetical protein
MAGTIEEWRMRKLGEELRMAKMAGTDIPTFATMDVRDIQV